MELVGVVPETLVISTHSFVASKRGAILLRVISYINLLK
jgi:hypothetical protein